MNFRCPASAAWPATSRAAPTARSGTAPPQRRTNRRSYGLYRLADYLTFVNYPASPEVTLHFDLQHRLTNKVDAVGTNDFGYWPGEQWCFEDGPWASDPLRLSYTGGRWRAEQILKQLTGGWTNTFSCDAAGRWAVVGGLPGPRISRDF